MKTHRLKSWPAFFHAILRGDKLHDLRRKENHDFQVGDLLQLNEYDPFAGKYTGRSLDRTISFITSNDTPCAYSSAALDRDYVILSLKQ